MNITSKIEVKATDLTFVPEDFDSVFPIETLITHISTIISEIRSGDVIGLETRNNIDKLSTLVENGPLTKDSDILTLLNAYENIKAVSMNLRQLLSRFIQLDTYESIAYAFYYNGERYTTDTISAEWLTKNSKGELRLNLDTAIQDIKKNFGSKSLLALNNIFNRHYSSYLAAISGTYKGVLGHGRLNRGHIAEAYEAHLAEHHSAAYQLLNVPVESAIDKMVAALEINENPEAYWSTHESIEEAWIHIRGSLGTQRGTVAGDVGRFQVKQGFSGNQYSSQVRLSSLANLKTGIKTYCDIVNLDIPVEVVARKVAMYLTEPVKKTEQNLKAAGVNEITRGLRNI